MSQYVPQLNAQIGLTEIRRPDHLLQQRREMLPGFVDFVEKQDPSDRVFFLADHVTS